MLALTACAEAGPAPGAPIERVRVPPGATVAAVAESLHAHGIIADRFRFRITARLRRLDRALQAGVYDFRRGERTEAVLAALAEGRTAAQRFTAPEGITLAELAALAAERIGVPADSVLAAARRVASEGVLPDAGPALEGFLLPETYTLPVEVSAEDLVRAMAGGFRDAWQPEWDARADTLGMTRREVVTLASIVEGEARVGAERATIAGVYHNRLRRQMPLQADPTVQYAIQIATGERKPRLFLKDYRFPSPYNTYLHPGLPPGPISSPGLASIVAALYPADVPWLYFVARGDGRHVFSATYREHVNAINRIRRGEPGAGSGERDTTGPRR
ncbi:MAG TPA: endolytic transglycosylase MltG [Gemmatimonadales bacterium]|nr:endolytic transglycosylase MltG [Gemmatimonadales bacterium]